LGVIKVTHRRDYKVHRAESGLKDKRRECKIYKREFKEKKTE